MTDTTPTDDQRLAALEAKLAKIEGAKQAERDAKVARYEAMIGSRRILRRATSRSQRHTGGSNRLGGRRPIRR